MNVRILRGISGSGKSFYANQTRDAGLTRVYSSDLLMVDKNGDYLWQPEKKDETHGECLLQFVECCTKKCIPACDLVIVDNTNIRAAECAPYYEVARAYGHNPVIITFVIDPSYAIERNVHGVDAKTIYRQHLTLERETLTMPTWWKHEVRHV